MPVKRRVGKRRGDVPDDVLEWLRAGDDAPAPCLYDEAELAAYWRQHGAAITDEWIANHPGTRPSRWWDYDAPRIAAGTFPGLWFDGELPEPRKRLGGIGTPAYEVLGYAPRLDRGVPVDWVTAWQVDYYSRSRPFDGVAIDPAHPPIFESEAAFLRRHNLLVPGEARRIKAGAYVPVPLEMGAAHAS